MQPINFAAINRSLLANAEAFVRDLIPGGHRVGKEYTCASIHGGEGRSFSVNLVSGIYKDFADDSQGGKDLVSLYAKVRGLNNGQAARELERQLGLSTGMSSRPAPAPVQQKTAVVVPDGTPDPDLTHPTHGQSSQSWRYRDAEGRMLMVVARYDPPDGKKQYCPFTYDGKRWNKRQWPDPQPIYGLDDLKLRPEATVVVVEGEKCVHAGRILSTRQVWVTWPGGANRWHKADWEALYGRRVVLWPDPNAVGLAAMQGLARALAPHCKSVHIFDVSGQPEDWDAAEAVAGGWTSVDFAQWAKSKMTEIQITAVTAAASGAIATPANEIATAGTVSPAFAPNHQALWVKWNLDCGNGMIPHPNINNAVAVLEQDPRCHGLVWYDDFLQKFMTDGEDGPREWRDVDDINLILYMQRDLGMHRMGSDSVRASVQQFAMRHRRHSVRDWLDGLVWDGESRIDHFFEDFFGAEGTIYTRAASKNFWISMVARIYRPGCKVDTMIVLEGEQGIRKSLAIQIIGGMWSTVQHATVTSKEFFEVMQGKLLIEIGEMDAFSRADITRVKDVISCPTDRYREPYARYAADHHRQCIFIGTTNRDDWNKDETGARRFHPVRCLGPADVDGIARWREQFFAEAVARLNPKGAWNARAFHFDGGEDWWSMPDTETIAQQSERLQEDPWQSFIQEYIHHEQQGDQRVRRHEPLETLTVNDILLNALHFKERSRIQRADERRVGACLTALGWRKRVGRVEGDERYGKVWKKVRYD